tara:strand:- start:182 stop:781 length:600 start_codon:yes stop_codon:yes gene_type:complete
MMAQESDDQKEIMNGMADLISSCTFGKLDARNLPMFDVEYIFLKIRAKSVGEFVDLSIICPDDEVTSVVKRVNIGEIDLQINENHSNKIDITDSIKLYLNYPILSDMGLITDENDSDTTFKMICRCFKELHSGDEIYHRVDIKDNDINEFLDQLNTEQFMGVTNFFETMPKLRHVVEVTNPKTNVTSEVLLEGLQSFLG